MRCRKAQKFQFVTRRICPPVPRSPKSEQMFAKVPLHCEGDLGSGMEGLEDQDLRERELHGLALGMDAWGEPQSDFFLC